VTSWPRETAGDLEQSVPANSIPREFGKHAKRNRTTVDEFPCRRTEPFPTGRGLRDFMHQRLQSPTTSYA
jgi:hypothetical protein